MKRALILTVGTGTRSDVYIVKPLLKTIRDSDPDFLVLLVTEGSRDYGHTIVHELDRSDDSYKIEEIEAFDDFQRVFRTTNQVFRDLLCLGYSPDDIEVDFTSGTKAMSSGAVLSAIYNQCQYIKYITGKRKNGVVIDGTERFVKIQPAEVFALRDIHLARELIFRLRFRTAEEIIKSARLDTLDDSERQLASALKQIAQAYQAWDIFNHKDALIKLTKVSWDVAVQAFRPTENALTLLETIVDGKEENKNNSLLIDLVNNASRRKSEGKYDDAVARLYRVTELFAQKILAEPPHGINTGDVDLERVPQSMRKRLETNRDAKDGKVKIGMVLGYQLLAELGHSAGKAFLQNRKLGGRLKERNASILAHGTKPISERVCNRLSLDVMDLLRLEMPDFEEQAKGAQFPWLTCG